MNLYQDHLTNYRVIRNGRKRRVFERIDFEGNHIRFVTHRSEAERERVRRDVYGGAKVVGILSWDEVHPWEFQ